MRYILLATLAVSGSATPAIAQSAAPLSVNLVCEGQGSVKRMAKNYAYKKGSDGPAFVANREPVSGLVRIEIANGSGRAQLPAALNPIADGDWQKISKLVIGEDMVAGKLETGLVTSAKLTVDRATGAISISGEMGDFAGRCRAADPTQRAF